jgi:hypothetical protein
VKSVKGVKGAGSSCGRRYWSPDNDFLGSSLRFEKRKSDAYIAERRAI